MKIIRLFLLFLSSVVVSQTITPSQMLFDDTDVAEVYVQMSEADLKYMMEHPHSNVLHLCTVRFKNKYINEEIDSVGIRIRGNTSRDAKKKSFKLSFNDFMPGREFYGLDKLNLNGEHNDPSISRSKICWDYYQKIGMVSSRAAHAALWINNKYYGLYVNVEHIDDEFIKKNFSDSKGNLWKCLWPANLEYWGNDPDVYKDNTYGRRTYDLKTNIDQDDYTQLARLINIINNEPAQTFPDSIESILAVDEVLKYFATNVLLGNWDAYRFLKNNYYLYYSPSEDLFHWIPYDYDNSLGIDFFSIDWATINPYSYANIDDTPRPLSKRLLAVPEYRNLFTHFLEFYSENVFSVEEWDGEIDSIITKTLSYAQQDTFRTKDYGYTFSDYLNSFTDADFSVGAAKRGIKNFINTVHQNIKTKLNYYSAAPYIYKINWTPKAPNANDSIRIIVSMFSHSPVTTAKVICEYGDKPATFDYDLKFSPMESKLVEDADRWIATIPPVGESGSVNVRIIAQNQLGLSKIYPRGKRVVIGRKQAPSGGIVINELMAKNSSTITDPEGEYEDWVELYNMTNEEISLGGKYLSDNFNRRTKWKFPDGTTIQPESFLLVWCDGDTNQTGLHAAFKLSASGEELILTDADTNVVLDSLRFGEMSADISYGRFPDGGSAITFLTPTPGAPNLVTKVESTSVSANSFNVSTYPNPVSKSSLSAATTVKYNIPASSINSLVQIKIFDVLGREVATIVNGKHFPGVYSVKYDVAGLPSGVYFIRSVVKSKNSNDFQGVKKLLILK